MKIFDITDLHGSLRHLDAVRDEMAAADLLILSGDITNFGGPAEAEQIIEALAAVNADILAVAGNCDRPSVEGYLSERGINLNGTVRELSGVAIAGLGGSLPGPGPTPHTYSEQELGETLAAIRPAPGRPFLFVSHQPPLDSAGDLVASGRHVGSRSVREFIERTRPILCLTGHIHESVGQGDLGGCRVVNPGPYGHGRYAVITISEVGEVVVTLNVVG